MLDDVQLHGRRQSEALAEWFWDRELSSFGKSHAVSMHALLFLSNSVRAALAGSRQPSAATASRASFVAVLPNVHRITRAGSSCSARKSATVPTATSVASPSG